jgi:hypothetical protein
MIQLPINSLRVDKSCLYLCRAGFLKQTPRACCGAPGVGEYNFNLTSKCGEPGAYACEDPSNHWSWDGIHLTEASYGHIAKGCTTTKQHISATKIKQSDHSDLMF